jgi:lysophospholipase L1-like esterase
VGARLRRIAGNALLVLGSIALCLALFEVALRIAGVEHKEARISCLDRIIGNVYCAGIEAMLDGPDGKRVAVKINAEGMADRDYPLEKPAGALRVALLGDSVSASLSSAEERKFKGIWQRALSERLQRPVEIMNFAIDGTGTWEQIQIFHLRARKYRPDYVVLGFFWGNDVWNNEATSKKRRVANPLKDEYPEETFADRARIAQRTAARWLWNHTYLYQMVRSSQDRLRTAATYNEAMRAAGGDAPDPAFAWNSAAWKLTRELMLKLKAEVERSGAKLVVVQIPMLDQIIGAKPLPYAELRAFLAQHGVASVDAFEALDKLAPKEKESLYIVDRQHLNEAGHRFFAQATLSALEAALRK